jgi:flavin reductase (DIM6/NTAB) family NADH-FMN oxidoreductase RutF
MLMKKLTMAEALKKTSPHPVSLICSNTPEGVTNLAAVSWWTYLESEPPIIGFTMWKESYTWELVTNTGKVVISIPGHTISDEALQCGLVSGRDVNKAEKYGIKLVDAPIGYPVHSLLAFICTIENKVDVGECTFFICKVDEIYSNEDERQLFAWSGSEKLAPIP